MLSRSTGLILALSFLAASRGGAEECTTSGPLPDGAVFIGYSREDESALHSVALLEAGVLASYDGRNLTPGLVLHEAAAEKPATTTIQAVTPYLERMGADHCEYPARLAAPEVKRWRIWSSEPLKSLRQPTEAERLAIRSLRPDCVHQGGPPPDAVTCVYAELLAVSDIDSDGKPEYWQTTPFRWDTGFTISERTAPSLLEPIVGACPGCSD